MIKAIIFDLGGVYFTPGVDIAIAKITEDFNIPMEKAAEALCSGREAKQYRLSDISEEDFWNNAVKVMETSMDYKILKDLWYNSYAPIEGTLKIIREIRKNYSVYLISNNVIERVEFLEKKFNFKKDFDDCIFSCDVKLIKPDKKIYELAIKNFKINPQETIFIDDKQKNLTVPSELGMKTIHFKNPDQLKEELINFGIKL
jgi:epoxide hydrolase-like predicted phosphatase